MGWVSGCDTVPFGLTCIWNLSFVLICCVSGLPVFHVLWVSAVTILLELFGFRWISCFGLLPGVVVCIDFVGTGLH